jgi:hypothetical protein
MADNQFLATDNPLHFDTPVDTSDKTAESPTPTTTRSGGPEGPRSVEQQKTETQMAKEQPPFIKELLAQTTENQKQAQQIHQTGDNQRAVEMEEKILQRFAELDATQSETPQPEPVSSPEAVPVQPATAAQPPHHQLLAEGEVALEPGVTQTHAEFTVPESASASEPAPAPELPIAHEDQAATGIGQVSVVSSETPILAEEPDGKMTMQELHQLRKQRQQEVRQHEVDHDDEAKQTTVELLQALIAQINEEEQSQQLEQLTGENSDDALYRLVEKGALSLLANRIREGKWKENEEMDSVALRLGIYGVVGMLRDLKMRAQSEPTRTKLQQVIDYLLNEHERIEVSQVQQQAALDTSATLPE